MRILVVEDEPKTGDYLKQGLTEAGFMVDLARDGLDGLHLALTEAYELAVLDVMLPGIEGWQVLQGIRKAGKDMPVLFLTARDSVDDRVKGLELGADDYLVKPFAFSELLARVRTESPRELRRLHYLREWSHEQDEQIFPGSQRACRTTGAGGAQGSAIAMGSRRVDSADDWMFNGHVARVGQETRSRYWRT